MKKKEHEQKHLPKYSPHHSGIAKIGTSYSRKSSNNCPQSRANQSMRRMWQY